MVGDIDGCGLGTELGAAEVGVLLGAGEGSELGPVGFSVGSEVEVGGELGLADVGRRVVGAEEGELDTKAPHGHKIREVLTPDGASVLSVFQPEFNGKSKYDTLNAEFTVDAADILYARTVLGCHDKENMRNFAYNSGRRRRKRTTRPSRHLGLKLSTVRPRNREEFPW